MKTLQQARFLKMSLHGGRGDRGGSLSCAAGGCGRGRGRDGGAGEGAPDADLMESPEIFLATMENFVDADLAFEQDAHQAQFVQELISAKLTGNAGYKRMRSPVILNPCA